MSEEVWSEKDTSPGAIEAALRDLLLRHAADGNHDAPARVLNLIAIVDREWRGEVENRLERVGRYHASRTILCAVGRKRTTIDARAAIISSDGEDGGPTHERVVVDVGERHLPHLNTIVDPLVVTDLPTLVWAPHGHADAVDSVMPIAQVVLLDTVEDPDIHAGLQRARALAERAYVVDLAWLRSTPWRERVAAAFDPPKWRPQLPTISSVEIRHHPDSGAAALLFLGWLSSRLGWKPGALSARGSGGGLAGRVRTRRDEIALTLNPEPQQSVPGLAGITIETAQGMKLSMDRGEGGLRVKRETRRGKQAEWTAMGASRGESGILGEGIRQALLRDPTYRPALDAASVLVG